VDDGIVGQIVLDGTVGDVDSQLDEAWLARAQANRRIVTLTATRLADLVRAHLPSAQVIVVREDTSHLPAHGHLDRVEDADGLVLLDTHHGEWHDLPWSAQADDDVWDLYHVAEPGMFHRDADGVRRFRVVLG
jgi:hypothetical protein